MKNNDVQIQISITEDGKKISKKFDLSDYLAKAIPNEIRILSEEDIKGDLIDSMDDSVFEKILFKSSFFDRIFRPRKYLVSALENFGWHLMYQIQKQKGESIPKEIADIAYIKSQILLREQKTNSKKKLTKKNASKRVGKKGRV